ncbi:MAG TPA: 50S ribosomal protein L11 methyltransferase [Candidatus Saccharimonadales bacterium]|nr:50S ribosomal protein L11 methyltransferase [Candidatus Saccharimonadales bacterium]
MYTLLEDLITSSDQGRRDIAANVVAGMLHGDHAANSDYMYLVQDLLLNDVPLDLVPQGLSAFGLFPAGKSCTILQEEERVSGFLRAIDRAPQAGSAIDAGCGSSAVLAVATAVMHPHAEVFAYELNPQAARCAQFVIELFGFKDRITVEAADVLSIEMPKVDLAVTETFGAALLWESGPKITSALGKVATTVIPTFAKLFARDMPIDPLEDDIVLWHHAGTVNLLDHANVARGKFASSGTGLRRLRVYSGFYDNKDEAVVASVKTDAITTPESIGALEVSEAGQIINFRYRIGVDRKDSYPRIWTQKAA